MERLIPYSRDENIEKTYGGTIRGLKEGIGYANPIHPVTFSGYYLAPYFLAWQRD